MGVEREVLLPGGLPSWSAVASRLTGVQYAMIHGGTQPHRTKTLTTIGGNCCVWPATAR
jgi:hypothetical protein